MGCGILFIMISKSVLGTIIKDQLQEFKDLRDSVIRTKLHLAISYKGSAAFVVKGLRRSGKSTLLKQIITTRYPDNFLYFNFDDERLIDFTADDFQVLMETMIELFGKSETLVFDEIQNITGWELFINRILREGYTVFITGSNAHLLSKELGTHLTGRHVDIELYPFSFTEFLKANSVNIPMETVYSTEEKALLSKQFKQYFEKGGMPEVVTLQNEQMLTSVVNDIIYKDIVSRYNIRKPIEFKTILKFLIANISNQISYRSIQHNFNIQSSNTIQKYIEYAEDTYLIFMVHRYEPKLKQFDKNLKKIYCIDNGIILKHTPNILKRQGALLENLVAVHLKRQGKEFYYYRGRTSKECDFVIPNEKEAIQVCAHLHHQNMDREIKGLIEALDTLHGTQGRILTFDQEEQLTTDNKTITIQPVWKWLLEHESTNE